MIRIENIRTYNPKDNPTYIHVKVDRSTIFGNPYPLSSESYRDTCVSLYRKYFDTVLLPKSRIRETLSRLSKFHKEGRTIVLLCWCAPKKCHAEVIKEYIEKL
jgi:hypothetical protein